VGTKGAYLYAVETSQENNSDVTNIIKEYNISDYIEKRYSVFDANIYCSDDTMIYKKDNELYKLNNEFMKKYQLPTIIPFWHKYGIYLLYPIFWILIDSVYVCYKNEISIDIK
jgi:hypothetical protein